VGWERGEGVGWIWRRRGRRSLIVVRFLFVFLFFGFEFVGYYRLKILALLSFALRFVGFSYIIPLCSFSVRRQRERKREREKRSG